MLPAKIDFIDQTVEIESFYLNHDSSDVQLGLRSESNVTGLSSDSSLLGRPTNTHNVPSTVVGSVSNQSPRPHPIQPPELFSVQRVQYDAVYPFSSPPATNQDQDLEYHLPIPFVNCNNVGAQSIFAVKSPCESRSENSCVPNAAGVGIPDISPLSPSVWKEQFFWPDKFSTTQCICLVRYFVREVAPSVSTLLRFGKECGQHTYVCKV